MITFTKGSNELSEHGVLKPNFDFKYSKFHRLKKNPLQFQSSLKLRGAPVNYC